jgi:hypothetical protein
MVQLVSALACRANRYLTSVEALKQIQAAASAAYEKKATPQAAPNL